MKKFILKSLLSFLLPVSLCSSYLFAQNGTECYKPLVGLAKTVAPVQNTTVCVNCSFVSNINNVIDNNSENSAQFDIATGVLVNNGLSVRDTVSTYPGGWYAGYVLDLGSSSLLTADVLSAFTVSTYRKGQFKQSATNGSGLAVATVAGTSQGRVYLNFKTDSSFDEVRFRFSSVISGLTTFRVYYATAFDPDCGTLDVVNNCDDQMAGSKARVTFNGGLANALTTIDSIENLTDGNKRTYAKITVPASVALLGNPPYIGILDEQRIYPAGQKTGFVIRYESTLLSASVLNTFRIQTYLFGIMQEQATSANLLRVNALGIGSNDKSISFTTTKKFNEIRLVLAQTASVNIGVIRVGYAFEEPQTCTSCENVVGTGQPGIYAATIGSSTGDFGTDCLTVPVLGPPAILSNAEFAVDSDTTNFATYRFPLAGSGCGFNLSVKMSDTVHRKSFVGFVVEQTGGLATLNLLNNITIRTYRAGALQNTASGTSLVNLGALSLLNAGKYRVGFIANNPFDEVEITFNTGTLNISIAGQFRTYYPFIIRDDDSDSVPDCKEMCGFGDDGIDTDGDGTPDACDTNGLETPLNVKVLLQGALMNAPALEQHLMRYDLNIGNHIPLQQPYSSSMSNRFSLIGSGSETVKPSVLGRLEVAAHIIVDWVLIEIRSSSNPVTKVRTLSGLVQRNGDIVDTLGGPLTISLPAGSYYLSVKHRNHLGVMTATASVVAGQKNTIDFTKLLPAQVFGTYARAEVWPGVYALWAGDVNSDGKVKYQGPDNDPNPILDDITLAAGNALGLYNYDNLFGYFRSDVDLTSKPKYQGRDNDSNIILDNVLLFPLNIEGLYNYDLFVEQIPK